MCKGSIGIMFFLTFLKVSIAQTNTHNIKGHIIDSIGNTVIGATIKSTTGNTYAISTKDGFMIQIASFPDTLIITSLGHKTLRKVVNSDSIVNIRLQDQVANLDEVKINTGYQSIPKERSTGSFTLIDNKTLNRQVGTNIIDRLKGVTSGLLFDDAKIKEKGKSSNFNIHGLSSINGKNDPLIILDNFPFDGDINSINPDDIESITILKDAAAASIWGAQAGNGVIVITSKQGKFEQPLNISLRATTTYGEEPDLYSLDRMSVADYVNAEMFLYSKGYFDNAINGTSYQALTPVVEILHKKDIGILRSDEAMKMIDELKKHDTREDLQKYVYRPTFNQNYSIGLDGGNRYDAYKISLGVDKNINELNMGMRRITGSVKNIFKIRPSLSFYTEIQYSDIKSSTGKPSIESYGYGSRNVPYFRLVDGYGNAIATNSFYRGDYTDTAGGGKLLNWKYYPLNDYKHSYNDNQQRSVLLNLGFNWKIFKDFKLDVKYQYLWQSTGNSTLNDTASFYTRDLINKYSQIDPSTGEVIHNLPIGSILTMSNTIIKSNNIRGQFTYSKQLSDININGLAGSEIRKSGTSAYGFTTYGFNQENNTSVAVNELQQFPSFLGDQSLSLGNSRSFAGKQNNFVSYFGNAAVSYLNRYTVSGSFRKDASNLFGINVNHKWNPFWSVGLSWDISKERFFDVPWIDYLKIRSTVGISGNVDQSLSAVTVIKYSSSNGQANLPFAVIAQNANPDLGWETIRTSNVGVDFTLKNNVLHGSIDYYIKNASDLIGPYYIDPTSGLQSTAINKNVANMKGKGLDLILGGSIIDRKFKWSFNFLLSYYVNRVTKYNFDLQRASDYIGGDNNITPMVGLPLYAIGGYLWGGLNHETGAPTGYLDGELSMSYDSIMNQTGESGVKFFGSGSPKYYGSISNIFTWKRFSVDFNIQYKFGHYFRHSSVNYMDLVFGKVLIADYAKRWLNPGDELFTNIPAFNYPVDNAAAEFYSKADINIAKADIIRFQFLNVSYELPSKHPGNFFKNIQINLNINNIGVLWTANRWHVDPEYQDGLSPARTYSLGLNANF